jgi:hypothetical protein
MKEKEEKKVSSQEIHNESEDMAQQNIKSILKTGGSIAKPDRKVSWGEYLKKEIMESPDSGEKQQSI